jgi:hypothetical protein
MDPGAAPDVKDKKEAEKRRRMLSDNVAKLVEEQPARASHVKKVRHLVAAVCCRGFSSLRMTRWCDRCESTWRASRAHS